jgi:acetyl-CoA synthetase
LPAATIDLRCGSSRKTVRIARTHSTRWPADRIRLLAGHLGDDGRNELATAGGYYHTGDIASRDADGYFTYIGRTDDLFRASDYKISAFELESVLIEHPAVVEALVVLAPDPARLTVPKAYISLAAGWAPDRATADAIFAHARRNLAPYQRIRRIEFMELPKTISGKIRRVDLRARENTCEPDDLTHEYATGERLSSCGVAIGTHVENSG